MGGVINILSHSEVLEEVENRIKALECEQSSSRAKIESLENWVLKQSNTIEELQKKLSRLDENADMFVKESNETESIRKKNYGIEIEMKALKRSAPFAKETSNQDKSERTHIKCKVCVKRFKLNSDFEKHMVENHQHEKKFECQSCRKYFYLEWRLKKHILIHKRMPSSVSTLPTETLALSKKLDANISMNTMLRKRHKQTEMLMNLMNQLKWKKKSLRISAISAWKFLMIMIYYLTTLKLNTMHSLLKL